MELNQWLALISVLGAVVAIGCFIYTWRVNVKIRRILQRRILQGEAK